MDEKDQYIENLYVLWRNESRKRMEIEDEFKITRELMRKRIVELEKELKQERELTEQRKWDY